MNRMLGNGRHPRVSSLSSAGRSAFFASIAVLALIAPMRAGAELANGRGFWLTGLGQGSFEAVSPELSKLHWWFDAQLRLFENRDGFGQGLVRPALGWALAQRVVVWAGYAWVRDSPATGSATDEHRIWEQLIWSHAFEHWSLAVRPRFEQRFKETGDDVGWRFRQFVKGTYPFPFLDRLALASYEELFLNMNDTDWGAASGVDSNRFFVGLQWKFDSRGRLKAELGYLNLFTNKSSGLDSMDHLLNVNLFLTF